MNIPIPETLIHSRLLPFDDFDHLRDFNREFSDENFEFRYFENFDWFEALLQNTNSILNVGCSRGRESFALAWRLGASKVVGIDVLNERIEAATRLVETTTRVLDLPRRIREAIDRIGANAWQHEKEQMDRQKALLSGELQSWHQSWPELLLEAEEENLPRFRRLNITDADTAALPVDYIDHFDLVYSRYVLHIIHQQGGPDSLAIAARNISKTVKPRTGRVVLVEPGRMNGEPCDYVQAYFEQEGLIKIAEEDDARILGLDVQEPDENTANFLLHPVGFVYMKSG